MFLSFILFEEGRLVTFVQTHGDRPGIRPQSRDGTLIDRAIALAYMISKLGRVGFACSYRLAHFVEAVAQMESIKVFGIICPLLCQISYRRVFDLFSFPTTSNVVWEVNLRAVRV